MRIRVAPLCIPAAVAIVAIGGHAAYANRVSAQPATSEYAEYRNDEWHYSLAVPADMILSEHEREGGGHTTQFMDAAGDKELLTSAWPYTQLDLALGEEGSPNSASDQSDHLEIVDVLQGRYVHRLVPEEWNPVRRHHVVRRRSLADRSPHHLAIRLGAQQNSSRVPAVLKKAASLFTLPRKGRRPMKNLTLQRVLELYEKLPKENQDACLWSFFVRLRSEADQIKYTRVRKKKDAEIKLALKAWRKQKREASLLNK